MALRISLRDGEQVVVNGAVLRATGRVSLWVENSVTMLRSRDVMPWDQANTPARRLYFSCMMAYIDPADEARHQDAIIELVRQFMEALSSPDAHILCVSFAQKVATRDYYRALSDCRRLIDYETQALARGVPANDVRAPEVVGAELAADDSETV